ncbi:MAG: hypothetical protein IPN08_10130 [Bacteroidales bacterium]|nr:hypothetical protein [Bacteroidales bacterium]
MGLQEQIEEEAARMNKGEESQTDEKKTEEKTETKTESPAFDILAHYNTNFGLTAATKEEAEEQLKTAYTKYNEIKDLPEKFTQTQTELNEYKTKAEGFIGS